MSLRANWLVALRAVLALALPFIFIPGNYRLLLLSVGLMLIIGVTDLLDGQIARRSGKTSAVGELLDSIADGMARITALIVFVSHDLLPLWAVLLLVWRDLISWGLRFMALAFGEDKKHKLLSGKVNGALQSLLLGLVVLRATAQAGGWGIAGGAGQAVNLVTPLTALICLWSILDLVVNNRATWRKFLGVVGHSS